MFGRALIYTLIAAAIVSVLLLASHISYDSTVPVTEEAAHVSAPEPSASAWIVTDMRTGETILGAETETVLPIASVVKLFTAYAWVTDGSLEETVTIVPNDVATDGRSGALSVGDRLTRRQLLAPLLLESSNDAATAIERILGRDAFLGYSNALITELELEGTTVFEPTGLSFKSYSSPHDLSVFLAHVTRTERYILDYSRVRSYVTDGHAWLNNSPALNFSSYEGGKHGYTPEAGHTFAGVFALHSETPDTAIVLLGSSDIAGDLEGILDFLSR